MNNNGINRVVPGDRVCFKQTNGDHVIAILYGTVLAIGAQSRGIARAPAMEDGALVAWDANPYTGEPSYVSFTPFWNQRFQVVS